MNDYKEVVIGRIVSGEKGYPVDGAVVKLYDKDLLIDDHLGTAISDKDGGFRVEFNWSDYKDGPFEERPDIFCNVTNPVSGKTTKTKVYDELEGELNADESAEIMDLGDIQVD